MGRLNGKAAIVTGAASGIGLATAELFARESAAVLLTDLRAADLSRQVDSIRSAGGRAASSLLDVSSADDWERAFEAAEALYGRIAVLVNNAGIAVQQTIEETDLASWRRVTSVNLDGTFLGCKHAIAHMKQRGGGSIINISSTAALRASAVAPAYGASKAGVWSLTQTVALHCAKAGYDIRCNSVLPGLTRTALLASASDEMIQRLLTGIPMGKPAEPKDIAQAVLYLASDEAKHVTGAALVVDGGTLVQ